MAVSQNQVTQDDPPLPSTEKVKKTHETELVGFLLRNCGRNIPPEMGDVIAEGVERLKPSHFHDIIAGVLYGVRRNERHKKSRGGRRSLTPAGIYQ